MKPSPFTYHRPERLEEALAVLADLGPDGKVLAGGQSLLPILSMRLAAPTNLVDINRLTDLAYVRSGPDGVRVGALARHRALERDAEAWAALPLLRQAVEHVAHPTIRNRGTSVGSLVHADPSGELTAVLALTGGHVELACASGRRTVAGCDFFVAPLESAVRPGELAVAAWFPTFPAGTGTAFVESARRQGDYATAGLAAAVTIVDGRISSARAAYISMSPSPVVVELTPDAPEDAALAGQPAAWAGAAEAAVAGLAPEPDVHATAAYRAHLARALTGRAMALAVARAVSHRTEEVPA